METDWEAPKNVFSCHKQFWRSVGWFTLIPRNLAATIFLLGGGGQVCVCVCVCVCVWAFVHANWPKGGMAVGVTYCKWTHNYQMDSQTCTRFGGKVVWTKIGSRIVLRHCDVCPSCAPVFWGLSVTVLWIENICLKQTWSVLQSASDCSVFASSLTNVLPPVSHHSHFLSDILTIWENFLPDMKFTGSVF